MIPPALLNWAESLQASGFGSWLIESPIAFPVLEGLHLIGLSLAVGLLFLIDLRLVGLLWTRLPAPQVLRQLRPVTLMGFGLVFTTGGLLFWAEAPALVASPAFPFKLLFLALAGINALYFEWQLAPGLPEQPDQALPPAARIAGYASIGLWTLVIVCGRLIPYLPSWD